MCVCVCVSFIIEINNLTISQRLIIIGVGRPFKLNCSSPEAKPKAIVTWIFNNVTIATSEYYAVSSATLSDDGIYTCRAENIAGYKESIISVTILGMLLLFIVFAEDNIVYSIQRSQLLLLIA